VLRSADRQSGGQRVYGDADVKRLTFIRRCREFGFSIEQVRSLVALVQDPQSSCMHARNLAQQHLDAVRAKLSELRALERSIGAFVASCDASCAGGPGPECVILDDLSKPSTKGKAGRPRGRSIGGRRN
jgi:MerR family transcriptional regulator, copper efflux regulator